MRAAMLAAAGALLFACPWAAPQSAASSAAPVGAGIVGRPNRALGSHPGELVPPRVAQAQRFLARRGLKPGQRFAPRPNGLRLKSTQHPAFNPNLAADS